MSEILKLESARLIVRIVWKGRDKFTQGRSKQAGANCIRMRKVSVGREKLEQIQQKGASENSTRSVGVRKSPSDKSK